MLQWILATALVAAAPDTTKVVPPALPAVAVPVPGVPRHASAPGFSRVPRPVPTDSLDLVALEREALLKNPTLAAMRATATAARARARVAGSLEDPMVSLAVAPRSYSEASTSMPGESTPAGDRFPAWRAGVRQRLPIFGERGLERASASADAAAALLDAEAARLDLLERVRLAFFDLYRVERAIETSGEQINLMNQFRRVALTRYAAGTDGQQDPLAADAELGMLAHERASLEREQRIAIAELNTLLHRDPGAAIAAAPLTLVVPAPDTAGAGPADWPEVLAGEARIAASEARASLSARRRLPVLEVGVEQDLFMEEPERRTVAMLGFNLPIAGGRGAAIAEARAERQRAESERDAASDAQALRLARARADWEESTHEVEVLETIVAPTSERSVAAARAAYENGRGAFLPLIEATRRRAEVRLEIENARVRAARGWAELARATARDLTTLSPEGKEPR